MKKAIPLYVYNKTDQTLKKGKVLNDRKQFQSLYTKKPIEIPLTEDALKKWKSIKPNKFKYTKKPSKIPFTIVDSVTGQDSLQPTIICDDFIFVMVEG